MVLLYSLGDLLFRGMYMRFRGVFQLDRMLLIMFVERRGWGIALRLCKEKCLVRKSQCMLHLGLEVRSRMIVFAKGDRERMMEKLICLLDFQGMLRDII